MRRTLVVSDIHGCVDEFKQLLNKVNFNAEEDQLVLLGDYVDRGPESRETVEFVMFLVVKRVRLLSKGTMISVS